MDENLGTSGTHPDSKHGDEGRPCHQCTEPRRGEKLGRLSPLFDQYGLGTSRCLQSSHILGQRSRGLGNTRGSTHEPVRLRPRHCKAEVTHLFPILPTDGSQWGKRNTAADGSILDPPNAATDYVLAEGPAGKLVEDSK